MIIPPSYEIDLDDALVEDDEEEDDDDDEIFSDRSRSSTPPPRGHTNEYVIKRRGPGEPRPKMPATAKATVPPYRTLSCTVAFPYPAYMTIRRPRHDVGRRPVQYVGVSGRLRYRIDSDVPDYYVVSRVARGAGLRPTNSTARCNLFWGRPLSPEKWELLTSLQRVNHFPGMTALSRKDNLARHLRHCPFLPKTFVLPADRLAFQEAAASEPNRLWIVKPWASSCGRGIRLIDRIGQLGAKCKAVVSRYIERPYLIDGYKFDIRLYFVVTCMDPLRIYTLDDGLVRFATQRYSVDKSSLKQKCVHLTNFSVNRHSKAFVKATDGAQGSKWSFKALLAYLAHQTPPVDVEKLVERINDIAVRSIIAVEPVVAGKMEAYRCPRTACFEVLGFDILLDQELNPWLLEINSMPSLSSSSSLDKFIKTKLIADVFHTIGMVPAENDLKVIRRVQTRRLKRVIGLRRNGSGSASASAPAGRQTGTPISWQTLSNQDLAILREVQAEYERSGHLIRIYPTRTNAASYRSAFKYERYNNKLVCDWLALDADYALTLLADDDPDSDDGEY
ncbi:hypothetical protein PBRA_005069 [Plasmodiophora brassicae]|nr:hypothetical protein PBRA_005069 [Plasmodiophora brassicae]